MPLYEFTAQTRVSGHCCVRISLAAEERIPLERKCPAWNEEWTVLMRLSIGL